MPTNKNKTVLSDAAQEQLFLDLENTNSSGISYKGGVDPSKFNKYLDNISYTGSLDPRVGSLEQQRAVAQPTSEQLGYGIARAVVNIVPTVVENFASILDFEDYVNQDAEIGNGVTRAMQEFKERRREGMPIYRENPNKPMDMGDPAWWIDNGSSLAESIGAFVLTGYGTGAALSGLSKLGQSGKIAATLLNASMLNQAESIQSATGVFNETVIKGLRQGLSYTESAENAGIAAAHVVNLNRANIFLNLTSAGAFLKNPTISRTILKNPKGQLGKRILGESLQEFTEEEINLIAEKEGTLKGELRDEYKFNLKSAMSHAFTMEGLEAGFLGAIGGAGQTSLTGVAGKYSGKESADIARYEAQQEELQRIEGFNEVHNVPLITSTFSDIATQKTLIDNINKASEDKNIELVEELQNKLLSTQSIRSFNNGTTGKLIEFYENIGNLDEETAESKKLDIDPNSPFYYKKRSELAVQHIKDAEGLYNTYKLNKYYNQGVLLNNLNDQQENLDNIDAIDSELDKVETTRNKLTSKLSTSERYKDISQENIGDELATFDLIKDLELEKKVHTKLLEKNIEEYKRLTSDSYQEELKKEYNTFAENQAKAETVTESKKAKAAKKDVKTNQDVKTKLAKAKEAVKSKLKKTPKDKGLDDVANEVQNEEAIEYNQMSKDQVLEVIEDDEAIQDEATLDFFLDAISENEVLSEEDVLEVDEAITKKRDLLTGKKSNDVRKTKGIPTLTPEQQAEASDLYDPEISFANVEKIKNKNTKLAKESVDIEETKIKSDKPSDIYNPHKEVTVEEQTTDIVEATKEQDNYILDADGVRVVETNEENELKVPDAANAFANQTRKFTQSYDEDGNLIKEDVDNLINEGLPTPEILIPGTYMPGTPIKLVLNESFDGDISTGRLDTKGANIQVGWSAHLETLRQQHGDNYKAHPDYIKFVPIEIQDDSDNIIGYVHSTSWINSNNLLGSEKSLIEEQNKSITLREAIVEAGEINTTITDKLSGVLFINTKGEITTSEALKGDNYKLATGKNGYFAQGRSVEKDLDLDVPFDPFNGVTYAVFKGADNSDRVYPLKNKRFSESKELKNTLLTAIEIFYSGEYDQNIDLINSILNATGFDIRTPDGLGNYVKTAIYSISGYTGLKDFLGKTTTTTDEYFFRYNNGVMEFARGGKNSTIYSLSKGALETRDRQLAEDGKSDIFSLEKTLKRFSTQLDKNFINIDLQSWENNSKVPIITEEGINTLEYEDYIKANTKTDLTSVDVNGTHVYTISPKIKFDISKILGTEKKAKKVSEKPKAQSIITKPPKKKSNKSKSDNIIDDAILGDFIGGIDKLPFQKIASENIFDQELNNKIKKVLQEKYPEIELNYTDDTILFNKGKNVFNQVDYNNKVKYTLKVVDGLFKIAKDRKTISINTKAKPYIENNLRKTLSGRGIDSDQIDFIFDYMKENNISSINTEDLAAKLAFEFAYTVESNITESYQPIEDPDDVGPAYAPSDFYRNLTVSGGTNYTENEIRTPDITPSIKGHAQFSTDQGIGWFRSDEQRKDELTNKGNWITSITDVPNEFYYNNGKIRVWKDNSGEWNEGNRYIENTEDVVWKYNQSLENTISKTEITKTRRVLELQSDLFQKGRGNKDLSINESKYFYEIIDSPEGDLYVVRDNNGNFLNSYPTLKEVTSKLEELNGDTNFKNQNKFLQLLNKDSNWVKFFIQTIIQDSAKKGYEKVLFPKGETAAKIEGHQTIADEINLINNNISLLEKIKAGESVAEGIAKQSVYNAVGLEFNKSNIDERISFYKEKRSELKSQGIEKLKPIEAFYEIRVGNILKKLDLDVKTITDEYGNQWNEITIDPVRDLDSVMLQKNEADQIIGQANIDAMSVLINNVNQKQDTLPHEYAHHYIAWFRDSDIVQEGIKRFGSEEALVQAIGEQVVNQKGEAYNWWKKFVTWVLSKMSDEDVLRTLTDSFLTRRNLNSDQIFNEEINKIIIPDLGLSKQRSLIVSMGSIINKLVVEEGKITGKDVFARFKVQFENLLEQNEEANNEYGVTEINKVLDNFDQLANLTTQYMNRLKGSKIIDKNFEINQDENSIHERTSFAEDVTFTTDSKNQISGRLRRFLSFIPKLDKNGERVGNYIGLQSYEDFDEVYNTLHAMLHSIEPDYNTMVKYLDKYKKSFPYISELQRLLEESSERNKNEFVEDMRKHYNKMRFIIYRNNNDKSFSARVLDTDSNDVSRVIKSSWYDNFKEADNIIKAQNLEEDYVINPKFVKKALSDFDKVVDTKKWKLTVSEEEATKLYKPWLKSFGIELSDDTYDIIDSGEFRYNNKKLSLKAQFENANGILRIIYTKLKSRSLDTTLSQDDFFNDKVFDTLAKTDAEYQTKVFSNSQRDGNKTVYSYIQPKHVLNQAKRLIYDEQVLKDLVSDPFSQNSAWLNDLAKIEDGEYTGINNTELRNVLEVRAVALQALKQEYSKNSDDAGLDQLDETSHEAIKLALFTQDSFSKKSRTVEFCYPTQADKSTMMMVRAKSIITKIEAESGKLQDETMQELYSVLIIPEINRMKATEAVTPNIKGYKAGEGKFLILPKMNELDYTTDEFLTVGSEAHLAAEALIQEYINNLVNKKLSVWSDMGIGNNTDKVKNSLLDSEYMKNIANNDVKYAATDFIVNSLIANVNIFQLFVGDPIQFYKEGKTDLLMSMNTFNNIGKRLAGEISPGFELNDVDGEYRVGMLSDRVSASKVLKLYSKILSKSDLKPYNKINGTDAQEFTTLKEHIHVMFKAGHLDDDVYKSINKKIKNPNYTLTKDELGKVLQPMKPLQYGLVKDNNSAVHRKIYIKSSSFPLIPGLSPDLEKLRVAMETQNIDRVAFESAVKVGNTEKQLNIFNEDGSIVDDLIFEDEHVITLPRTIFRIQQEIPYDEEKTKINIGTQGRKLLFSNILELTGFKFRDKSVYSGLELRNEFDKLWSKLANITANKLIDEVGFVEATEDTEASINVQKLQQTLIKEANERNFPLNDIGALNLNEDGKFTLPLWSSGSSDRIEAMLSAIVTNRILRNKFPGKSYVLGTQEGFGTIQSFEDMSEDYKASVIYTKNFTGELLPQRVENGVVKPAQIIVPNNLRNQHGDKIDLSTVVDDDGVIDFKKLPEEVISLLGFRIPTQGHNSMSYMEIVGFLPDGVDDLLIAPREFTVQMGSDFDVDKLYTYNYSLYQKVNGEISKRSEDAELKIYNDILDIYLSVVSHPDVQEAIIKPLGFGKLPELANTLEEVKKTDNEYFLGMSDDYQRNKYMNARAGKLGIGVFSLNNTFNSIIQGHDLILWEDKLNNVKLKVKFGTQVSNGDLSDPKTLKKKSTVYKSDVHSAYQSAAVDNENEQLLDKLHINANTMNVIKVLTQLGFTEDTVIPFINQPIVIDYVAKLIQLQSTLTGVSGDNKRQAFLETLEKYGVKESKIDKSLADISGSEFMKVLSNPKYANFNAIQASTLAKFLKLDELAVNITSLQGLVNLDSKGLDKSLLQNNITEEFIGRIPLSNIENASNLFGEFEYDNDVYKLVKATTFIGSTIMNGLYLNNKLWNNFFPYDLPNVRDIFSETYRLSGGDVNSLRQYSDFSYSTWKQMKSYLYTNNDLGLTSEEIKFERERLLFNTEDSKSLSRIIKDLKASEFENAFISVLDTKLGLYKTNPDLIQYRNSAGENFGEENLYSAFLDLFRAETPVLDGKYNTRQIASDLVLYAYLNGGIQEALQFVKYVPMSYLNLIPFAKNLGEEAFVDTTVFGNIIGNNNPYIISKFNKQWIRHNGASLPKVDVDNVKVITGDKKKVNSIQELRLTNVELYVDRPEFRDIPVPPEVISIYNSKVPTKYSVFVFDSSTYTYKRVNNLGYVNGIREYDYQNNNQRSVYTQNNTVSTVKNTTTVEVKPLPEKLDTPVNDYIKLAKNKPGTKVVTDALEIIAKTSKNQYYNYIANQLLLTSDKLPKNIKVKIVKDADYMGHYDYATDTIIINANLSSSEEIEKTILHEIIHGYTGHAATVYDAFLAGKIDSLGNLSKSAQKTLKQLKILQTQYNNLVKNGGIYKYGIKEQEIAGFEHVLNSKLSEFITVTLTDENFQKILNKIKSELSPSLRQKFFNKLIKLLKDLGILTESNSILEDAVNLSLDLIKIVNPNTVSLSSSDYLFSTEGVNFLFDQEKELKLRNSDGSRKRFLKSKYKSLTLPKVQKINKQLKAERSSYKAKIITITGEKGDNKVYDAISLVPSDYNGINRLNSRLKNEIC